MKLLIKIGKSLSQIKYVFIALVCFILFIYTFFTLILNFTQNPIKITNSVNTKLSTLTPQGWAFFTRSPREAQIIIYSVADDGSFSKYQHKHSSLNNLFGLNRKSSKVLGELQMIKSNVADSLFENCKWNYQKLRAFKIPKSTHTIKNIIDEPILCGEFIIIFQKPIPWAWSKSIDRIEMPAKIIRLNIDCELNN